MNELHHVMVRYIETLTPIAQRLFFTTHTGDQRANHSAMTLPSKMFFAPVGQNNTHPITARSTGIFTPVTGEYIYYFVWISNYIHHKVWDEITYPYILNFNGAAVEVGNG